MSAADNFLNFFDADGRFRDGDGSLNVVFLTNQGGKYPGKLLFKGGFCVRADMDSSTNWSYPDGSPLNGLRMLLYFDREEPLIILIQQGRIITPDNPQAEQRSSEDVSLARLRSDIRIDQRAHTALLSLSTKEQDAVLDAVVSLVHQSPAEWPREYVQRLGKDQPVYLLRISAELRAFIRVGAKGQIELFDIVREATLRTFLEQFPAKSLAK